MERAELDRQQLQSKTVVFLCSNTSVFGFTWVSNAEGCYNSNRKWYIFVERMIYLLRVTQAIKFQLPKYFPNNKAKGSCANIYRQIDVKINGSRTWNMRAQRMKLGMLEWQIEIWREMGSRWKVLINKLAVKWKCLKDTIRRLFKFFKKDHLTTSTFNVHCVIWC